jgi:hypothetical protein
MHFPYGHKFTFPCNQKSFKKKIYQNRYVSVFPSFHSFVCRCWFSAFVFLIVFCMFIPFPFLSSDGRATQYLLPNNGAHIWAFAIQEGTSQRQSVQRICSEYTHTYVPSVWTACWIHSMYLLLKCIQWRDIEQLLVADVYGSLPTSMDHYERKWWLDIWGSFSGTGEDTNLVGYDVVYIGNVYASIFMV